MRVLNEYVSLISECKCSTNMNIFYLSNNTKECSQMHVDKHCVKMILEYAQLLSTAHRVLDGTCMIGISDLGRKTTSWILPDNRYNILYKATHINHPSAVWVRQSNSNYSWLSALLEDLSEEYTYRYGKIHKTKRDGLVEFLKDNVPKNIPTNVFTEPPRCMPEDCKIESVIGSYRNYYKMYKNRMAVWKTRDIPYWFTSQLSPLL